MGERVDGGEDRILPTDGRWHPALADVALIRYLSDDVRGVVAASFEPVTYRFGAEIIREGEAADAFYVVAAGTARVLKAGEHGEEVPLNLLGPGDSFGEVALIKHSTRTATVRASSELELLRLDRSLFQALLRTHPQIRNALALAARQNDLGSFLRMNSAFARLPGDALGLMLRELRTLQCSSGELVVRAGDPAGPMYVVQEGRLRAFHEQDGSRQDLSYIRKGDFFGERSLLAGEPRHASVEALTDCTLLELQPETVDRLLDEHPAFRERVEERVAQYKFRQRARIPLDFADELLPAGSYDGGEVDQVDVVLEEPGDPEEHAPRAVQEELAEDLFERPDRRIRRFPHVWQVDEMDCGAASLAMVCRHFGRRVSLAHVRRAVQTTSDGTSLLGIAHGAEQLGLAARTVKASKSNLDELPLPAIVHWEANHWLVLYDTDEQNVRVADPASGVRRIEREEFEQEWSGFAALVARTPSFDHAPEAESPLGWIVPLFRPYRAIFIKAILLALLAAVLQMVIPVFSQVVVDSVVADRDRQLLTVLLLGMLGMLCVAILAQLVQRFLLARTAVRIDGATLDFLTDRLLDLPMSYFHARRTGDIERRLAGLRQVRLLVVQNGVQAISAVTQLVVAVALMFVYSWSLALVFLATVPVYGVMMRYSRRRLRPLFDSLEQAFGKYQSRQIDAIKGIETVKAMGAEPALKRLIRRQFDELAHKVFRADFAMLVYDAAIQTVTFVSLALFLWVGALQVLSAQLSVGEFVAFNALVLLANAPINVVLLLWDELQYASVLLDRLQDIAEEEPEQGTDKSGLRPVPTMEGRVELRHVDFHYPGPVEVPILEDVTLSVEPGTTVALVGRSGSGKTTLVKLLTGLIEPTAGAVRYDGVDLRTLDYRELRRHVGFVLQDTYLFDETITRNISFGDEEPDMERVQWAARVAAAHEFVERLPLGYDTRVGETGLLLSGGQQQRIAIARAVYNRPPILVLDEATSSLDSESERSVQKNIDRLLEGRTSFVIAHRLSTVRDADLIVVLEKGRIAEQGTHEDLLGRQGLYYYLVSQQLGV